MPCAEAIVDGLADAVKPYTYLLYTPLFLRALSFRLFFSSFLPLLVLLLYFNFIYMHLLYSTWLEEALLPSSTT